MPVLQVEIRSQRDTWVALDIQQGEELTNTCTDLFETLASQYDALYEDKNYQAECDTLEEIFRRFGHGVTRHILDLGCGTGGHAIPLSQRGYEVVGVDRVSSMIEIARHKASRNASPRLPRFEVGDIRSFELGHTVDAVICMFAVLGYQTSNADLFAALRTIQRHLKPGGVFVGDIWYGPAVLKQRPSDRLKQAWTGDQRIIRVSKARLDTARDLVEVTFHLWCLRADQVIQESQETHYIRYFFLPEVEFFLSQAGLELLNVFACGQPDQPPSEETWNATIVARTV